MGEPTLLWAFFRSFIGIVVILYLTLSFAAANVTFITTTPLRWLRFPRRKQSKRTHGNGLQPSPGEAANGGHQKAPEEAQETQASSSQPTLGDAWYREFCEKACSCGWTVIVCILESAVAGFGVRPNVYGDIPPSFDRNVIVLANHSAWLDFAVLFALALRLQRLGSCKMLVKSMVGNLPLVGSALKLVGWVSLQRNWEADSRKLQRSFKALSDLADTHPFWLLMHPEGTRFSPDAAAKSAEYAAGLRAERTVGLRVPDLKHVLLPRAKGFCAALQTIGPSLDAIYDVTICYQPVHPRESFFRRWIKGGVTDVYVHVQRESTANLRIHDDRDMQQWIYDRFAKKDELIESYLKGEPQGTRWPAQLEKFPLQRAVFRVTLWTVLCYASWILVRSLLTNSARAFIGLLV